MGFIPREGFTSKRGHDTESAIMISKLRDEAREGGDSVTPDLFSTNHRNDTDPRREGTEHIATIPTHAGKVPNQRSNDRRKEEFLKRPV
jgi:hypothetical protein